MSKEVFVDFTGRAKLSPRTILKYTGDNPDLSSKITAEQWSELSAEEQANYTISNFNYAIGRAEECDCSSMTLFVE